MGAQADVENLVDAGFRYESAQYQVFDDQVPFFIDCALVNTTEIRILIPLVRLPG